jgi:alanyl-tRNA synthetase
MMTERLYYTDALLTAFTAAIVDVSADGRRVYLDRTAFYPTSGGQPHDLGTLSDASVIDVIDEDERIAHVLETAGALAIGETVRGVVDVARRFDFMQQHTGQHLLSALLADHFGWATVSVHFGDASCTVDVQASDVSLDQLRVAEAMANAIVFENRVVSVSFEDAATATGLRKPSDRTGELRIVTIDGIDRGACGGTHVRRTGEIGGIALRRAERTKGNSRIEFLCGMRVIRQARSDAGLVASAARLFAAAPEELPALVEKQQQRVQELERETRRLAAELARHDAQARWSATPPDADGVRRIRLPHSAAAVRDAEPLLQALIALGGCMVFASGAAPAGAMLGTSTDTNIDAGQTLRPLLAGIGGRGGGSPRVAQGSVPDESLLDALAQSLGFH